MQKLKQMVVRREVYPTTKEDFEKFVDRVSEACDKVDGKFLNVSYPNEDVAVILYKWSDGLH